MCFSASPMSNGSTSLMVMERRSRGEVVPVHLVACLFGMLRVRSLQAQGNPFTNELSASRLLLTWPMAIYLLSVKLDINRDLVSIEKGRDVSVNVQTSDYRLAETQDMPDIRGTTVPCCPLGTFQYTRPSISRLHLNTSRVDKIPFTFFMHVLTM